MKEFTFATELWLPSPLDRVFDFFSEARNLETLTPPWVHFEVLTPAPIVMAPGTLIDYQIRIRGFPVRWRTEIVEWNPRIPSRMCSFVALIPYGITPILSPRVMAGRFAQTRFVTVHAAAHSSIGCSSGGTWKKFLNTAATA